MLKAYGIKVGTERPDLVIVDRDRDAVASVVEVKYIAGDTAIARFREAVDQVVRYGRTYVPGGQQTAPLLRRSLVALSREAPVIVDATAEVPASIDFSGIEGQDALDVWARTVAELPW